MTTQQHPVTRFEPVITAATPLLAQRMGTPVQLTDVVCISAVLRY